MGLDIEHFESYYKILGLKNGPQDDNKVITDEMVEKAYEHAMKQLEYFESKARNEEEKEQIKKIAKSRKEAYEILKTEEKRKKYDEFEAEIRKAIKDKKEQEKIKEEMPKKLSNKPVNKDLTDEQYEQAKKATENAVKRMQPIKKIEFTPIYKGQFGKMPPQRKEDDGR